MPNYAYLSADVRCKCSVTLNDLITFQWGYCPGYGPREQWVYHLNSPINWRSCQDGSIPSWVYFEDGEANIGDSQYRNLVIIAPSSTEICCASCGRLYGGIAVEVQDGVITSARTFEVGEFDPFTTIIIVDGASYHPMADWENRTMTRISC